MYVNIMANTSVGCSTLIDYLEKEEESVKEFTEYLDKENKLGDKDYFFNHESDMIEKEEVTSGIDSNCYKLSRNEHRFFSLTVNPSKKEIDHLMKLADENISNISKAKSLNGVETGPDTRLRDEMIRSMMKEYTVSLMDEYAKNFNREGVASSKDLVWYAKVERDRYYKPVSKEVIHNKKVERAILKARNAGDTNKVKELEKDLIRESDVRKGGRNEVIKEWMPKSGDNYHVHIIVSRRDRERRYRLSPLSKARKNAEHIINGKKCMIGFNRNNFSNAIENSFDKITGYDREFPERYESRKLAKDNPELYRERLNEYLKQKYSREFVFQRDSKELQIPGHENMIGAGKRLAYKAGLDHIRKSTRPYIEVGGYIFNGAKHFSQDKISKEVSKELFYKTAMEYSRLAGMSGIVPAPYALGLNIAVKAVSGARSLSNQRDNEHSF